MRSFGVIDRLTRLLLGFVLAAFMMAPAAEAYVCAADDVSPAAEQLFSARAVALAAPAPETRKRSASERAACPCGGHCALHRTAGTADTASALPTPGCAAPARAERLLRPASATPAGLERPPRA